jgi:hypothetical protein
MNALFAQTSHGALVGGAVGAGIGLLASIIKPKGTPPQARYRNPTTKKWHVLNTFETEGDTPVSSYVIRLWQTLCMDPTSSKEARTQYHVAMYHFQKFLLCLHRGSTHDNVTQFKVELRSQGLRALRSMGRLESLSCGCREGLEILRFICELQGFIQKHTLAVDR